MSLGKFYAAGEDIPAVTEVSECNQVCRCETNQDGNAEIMCAMVDCPMDWGSSFDWDR